MSKNKLLFAAIVLVIVLIVASLAMFEWYGPKATITVEIDGKPGLAMVGTVTIDGEVRPIRTTLPAKLIYEARELTFRIVPSDRDRFAISNEVDIKVNGEPAAHNSGYGLKGEVFRPPLLPSMRLTALVFSMNEAEIAALQK